MPTAIRCLIAAVLLLTVALVPAFAVTLQPGTYQLEWRIPPNDEPLASFCSRTASMRAVSEAEAARFQGLASAKCYLGKPDGVWVILDESKGTDTGYDMAYIFPPPPGEGTVDLKTITKLPLKDNLGSLVSSKPGGIAVNANLGAPGSQITKKAMLDLEVTLTGENGRQVPFNCIETVRGAWYGTIKTDATDLKIQTVDVNFNGVYNDKLTSIPGVRDPSRGDMVLIGDPPDTFEDTSNEMILADAVSYDGKLYTLDVSETGDTIDIQPYTGETGTLVFDAKDGAGKPTACRWATVSGKHGVFFSRDGGPLVVPVGDYLGSAMITPKQAGGSNGQFAMTLPLTDEFGTIKVLKNKKARAKFGGPVSLSVEPSSRTIKVRRGSSKRIGVTLDLDGTTAWGLRGGREQISIKDPSGKVVANKQCEACVVLGFPIEPSETWKPGNYKIVISLNPAPYQKPIVVTRKLKVL